MHAQRVREDENYIWRLRKLLKCGEEAFTDDGMVKDETGHGDTRQNTEIKDCIWKAFKIRSRKDFEDAMTSSADAVLACVGGGSNAIGAFYHFIEDKDVRLIGCEAAGLDLISMIAPTSHDRIKMIAAEVKGFVYCVSSLGVTGVRSEITTDIGAMVRLVKEANPDIPCAVGFGISTPAQAEKMAAVSDGAIVGSAIVRLCEKYGREAAGPIGEYVRSMKVAVLQKD